MFILSLLLMTDTFTSRYIKIIQQHIWFKKLLSNLSALMTLITNRSMIHTAADKPTFEYSYRNHPHSYHLSKTIFTEERITNTERVVLRQLTQVTFLTTIILLFIAQSEVLFYALVRKSYGIPLCQVICLSQPMKIAAGKRKLLKQVKHQGIGI